MMKNAKLVAGFGTIWLLLTLIGYAIGVAVFSPGEYEDLENRGQAVYGKVTALEAENHQLVRYSYQIGNREFFGSGRAGGDNPAFDDLMIGSQVIVFYDKSDPETSILGYPSYDAGVSRQAVIASAVFFPIFPMIFLIGLYFAFQRLKR